MQLDLDPVKYYSAFDLGGSLGKFKSRKCLEISWKLRRNPAFALCCLFKCWEARIKGCISWKSRCFDHGLGYWGVNNGNYFRGSISFSA